MPRKQTAREKLEELCQTGRAISSRYATDSLLGAVATAGMENGDKLDDLNDKLDGLTAVFERIATALEESNEMQRAELDKRKVDKFKVG